jgi:carbamoyl-phosphate synthase large subunit
MNEFDDSSIRKNAIKYRILYKTTTVAVLAAARGITTKRNGVNSVKSPQDYHAGIK